MKRSILIAGVCSALLLGACTNEKKETPKTPPAATKSTQQAPARHPAPTAQTAPPAFQPLQPSRQQTKKKTELMEKMGLEIDSGRIILDTNKSREFFEALSNQLRAGVDKSVKKARLHAPAPETFGIEVQDGKMVIDLNRTRNFMEGWVETMEILGRELDRSLAPSQP